MTDTRSEAERLNAIMLKYGREPDVTLWRNNTGQHAAEIATRAHLERLLSMCREHGGSPDFSRASYERDRIAIRSLIRSLLAEKQRFTRYGLCKGSSDIVGIVQVSDELRGYDFTHGIFLALEVKTDKGKVTAEQQQFLDLVNRRGGVGRVVRNEDDAGRAIEEARRL